MTFSRSWDWQNITPQMYFLLSSSDAPLPCTPGGGEGGPSWAVAAAFPGQQDWPRCPGPAASGLPRDSGSPGLRSGGREVGERLGVQAGLGHRDPLVALGQARLVLGLFPPRQAEGLGSDLSVPVKADVLCTV